MCVYIIYTHPYIYKEERSSPCLPLSCQKEQIRLSRFVYKFYRLGQSPFSTILQIEAPCCDASPGCACTQLACTCYACRSADTWSVACRRTPADNVDSCRRKCGKCVHTWDKENRAGSRKSEAWACAGNFASRRDTSPRRSVWSLQAQIKTKIVY